MEIDAEKSRYKDNETGKSRKRLKDNDPEKSFQTSWICSECKEAECAMDMNADELLICDGLCQRLYHYPCAGLRHLPTPDENFICSDCQKQSHPCAFCQNYGKDYEDVFKCRKGSCGLFFHEACLDMYNIEIETTILNENGNINSIGDDDIAVSYNRVFVCPAHSCWVCTQIDLKEEEIADPEKRLTNVVSSSAIRITVAKNTGKQGKTKIAKAATGRKKATNTFEMKTTTLLTRCIECPISYHISCIPPTVRFHELATLCHEHSKTRKLPMLDHTISVQSQIEKKIDQHFTFAPKRQASKVRRKEIGMNRFFPGIFGSQKTKVERSLLDALNSQWNAPSDESLFFCLPCDLKEEVHLKPPAYKHIQSNQYHPINRPPKVVTSGQEKCNCDKFCGDDCLNRSLYVECFGDGAGSKKPSNCPVGQECGNRLFAQKKFIRCNPKREEGKGWGLTICENVKGGELIIEYVGEIIDSDTKDKRLVEWTNEHPNDPNFYIMALQPGWFIDAREKANLSRFVNHSCEPNCVILPVNAMGRVRCGIIALRDIVAGEFLSYDYHFDTRDGDKFVCRCGSFKCRGTMQGGNKTVGDLAGPIKKTKQELWEEAKCFYDRDKKFVQEYYEDCHRRSCLVRESVPGLEKDCNDELIANGAQLKHCNFARSNKVFLWRNADLGSNFASRFGRCNNKQAGSKTNN